MKRSPLKQRVGLRRTASLKSYTALRATKGLKRSNSLSLKKTPLKNDYKRKQKPPTDQKKLDAIVSKVVRLGSADFQGMVVCVTCLSVKHWKEIQCGHFQRRQHLATRYLLKNLASQCEDCNCFQDGQEEKFAEFIDSFYGKGTADELRKKSQEIIYDFNYKEEIEKWQQVLNNLLESKANQIEY